MVSLSSTDEPSELTDLRREVERLQGRLAQSANDLQDFLYIVSHDFRGPIRAIMSASMILQEDYADSLNAEAKAELKRQYEAGRKLSQLLEALVQLSRLTRREIEIRSIDLGQIAQAELDRRGMSHALLLTGNLVADVDRDLAEIMIGNLIDNSVKFAKPEGPKIEFGRDGQGFYFRDEGIGLSPEAAGRVFHPFEKVNGDAYPGVGVGLTAVKRIVDRHEGVVSAGGELGQGAEIRFTLGKAR